MSSSSGRWPKTERKVYERDGLRIRTVAVAVVSQVWPLLAFLGFFLATALAYLARSGDHVPAEMAWGMFEPAALGLTASFALHESAHAIALKRIHSVTHIAIDRAAWRTSVIPEGTMTARQIAGVALAGPGSCVIVGALIWLSDLDRPLAWWYLAHAVFLLPVFGDGRALRHSLRMARKQSSVEDTAPGAPKAPAP